MTDRFVTVPDSLELPAAVKVPVARLVGPTGAAATPADLAAATAAQGALAASASQPGHTHTLDDTTDTATRVAMTPAERTELASLSSTYAPIPTGTPDGTKYYRDDGSWGTPEGGGAVDSVNGQVGDVVLVIGGLSGSDLTTDIAGTTQTTTFSGGRVSEIIHTDSGTSAVVRTDAFTYGPNTVTEVRTLVSTSETLTIITNLTTYTVEVQ